MTHYEMEGENIMTPYTVNWSLVGHFAINHQNQLTIFFGVLPYRGSMRHENNPLTYYKHD